VGPDPGPHDDEVTADTSRLRTFLVADAALTAGSVGFILVVWTTVVPSRWLLLLALMVMVAGGIMLLGLVPLRQGRVDRAMSCLAVANWAIAVAATAIATFAWPILVFAALLPAVVSVPYVSRRSLHRYLGVSLVVSCGVAALGVLQDVTGFARETPGWVIDAVTITFVPAMAGLLVMLSLANRAHLQRLLDAALQANIDLHRSEESLAAVVDELRASRSRVVAATDEERRRIARDLHDGSQQRLAALGLNLSVVRELLKRSPDDAAEALNRLRTSVTEAQADLRGLVHGIYPPALTEHGVVEALGSAASYGPNVVHLVADDVGRHPPDVEAAVYFCCTEALQNATKHAGAEATVQVTIAVDRHGWLRFEVADDGLGFDPATARGGGGFVSMRDRVGALGGDLEVTSGPGRGTQVRGAVPTAPPGGAKAVPPGPATAAAADPPVAHLPAGLTG
jgi:signal transduction histidine kinase